MSKLEIGKVAEVLKKQPDLDPAQVRRIIEELNLAAQPDDGEEKAPAVKKQFVILVSDPENKLPKHDFVGWVVQIPENESVATVTSRVMQSAYDFNATKKGRQFPVSTFGEALENIPPHITKEHDLWIKTKTPVLMLTTDNQIPRDTAATKAA